MLTVTDCIHATIRDVAPGTIFLAAIGGETTVCFAVQPIEDRRLPRLLTLYPGHPQLRNRVGLLEGTVVSDQPLLVYPSARFVPSPKPEHLHLEEYREAPLGSLALQDRIYSIIAETGRGRAFFACEDGSMLGPSARNSPMVAFTSWEIMIEGPGGEPYTLCVVDAGNAAAGVFS